MTIAGLVNMSMLIAAAGIFHASGLTGVDDIDDAYDGLQTTWSAITPRPGSAIALLASGLSSSSVGTLAGQVVMQGFVAAVDPAVPAPARSTMAPAMVVLAIGVNPTRRAGAEPGRALVRHPVRADPAGAVLPQPRG